MGGGSHVGSWGHELEPGSRAWGPWNGAGGAGGGGGEAERAGMDWGPFQVI